MPEDITKDPRLMAAVDLIGRTGAESFRIQFADEEEPVVWFAVASWKRDGKEVYDAGAGMDARMAIFRLCDQVIDGGQCQHCNRPTGFEESADPMPLNELVCWYQYDPELKTFRRGCEGNEK